MQWRRNVSISSVGRTFKGKLAHFRSGTVNDGTETCGVTIITEERTLCSAMLEGLSENDEGGKFQQKMDGICNCLPEMESLFATDSLVPITQGGDLSPATFPYMVNTVHGIDRVTRIPFMTDTENHANASSVSKITTFTLGVTDNRSYGTTLHLEMVGSWFERQMYVHTKRKEFGAVNIV